MNECRIRDRRLVAVKHVQRMYASQMDECRIRDRRLVAMTHVQRMDA
jgi:hypothetical protein